MWRSHAGICVKQCLSYHKEQVKQLSFETAFSAPTMQKENCLGLFIEIYLHRFLSSRPSLSTLFSFKCGYRARRRWGRARRPHVTTRWRSCRSRCFFSSRRRYEGGGCWPTSTGGNSSGTRSSSSGHSTPTRDCRSCSSYPTFSRPGPRPSRPRPFSGCRGDGTWGWTPLSVTSSFGPCSSGYRPSSRCVRWAFCSRRWSTGTVFQSVCLPLSLLLAM